MSRQFFDREEREKLERALRADDQHRMQRRVMESQRMFRENLGLNKAIEQQVLPALFSIKLIDGTIGTGFFQHDQWPVTNAHVLPSKTLFNGMQLINSQGHLLEAKVLRSFHRPDRPVAPDVVILKTAQDYPCLLTEFNDNDAYEEEKFFYIDLQASDTSGWQVKHLRPLSRGDSLPFFFECIDQSDPQPGSSGSPIICARVTESQPPVWQFRVFAMLYARCSNTGGPKRVCAIPITKELLEVFKILSEETLSEGASAFSKTAYSLGDQQAMHAAAQYQKKGQQHKELAKLRIWEFEEGMDSLRVNLPPGLEKLWGSGLMKVSQSLMIRKNLLAVVTRKSIGKFRSVPEISPAELKEDFLAFIDAISTGGEILLYQGDNVSASPKGYFRIDVKLSGENWEIDIQDNIGKGAKHNGKSLSSVFAKVKVPAQQKHIKGSELAALFYFSQEQISPKATDLSNLSAARQSFSAVEQKNEKNKVESPEEASDETTSEEAVIQRKIAELKAQGRLSSYQKKELASLEKQLKFLLMQTLSDVSYERQREYPSSSSMEALPSTSNSTSSLFGSATQDSKFSHQTKSAVIPQGKVIGCKTLSTKQLEKIRFRIAQLEKSDQSKGLGGKALSKLTRLKEKLAKYEQENLIGSIPKPSG